MRNPCSEPSTFNVSDQLAAIDWAYDMWLESKDNAELNEYLGTLLLSFARNTPPSALTDAEYDHFTEIANTLCVAGGDSGESNS